MAGPGSGERQGRLLETATMTLLHAIETCLRLTNIPPSRFGRDSVRDPRLVHDLRRGREPGPAMERRVRAHIDACLRAARAGSSGVASDGKGRP